MTSVLKARLAICERLCLLISVLPLRGRVAGPQDVAEALRRLPPEEIVARNQRLKRAMDLSLKHEKLPKALRDKQTPFEHYLLVGWGRGAQAGSCMLSKSVLRQAFTGVDDQGLGLAEEHMLGQFDKEAEMGGSVAFFTPFVHMHVTLPALLVHMQGFNVQFIAKLQTASLTHSLAHFLHCTPQDMVAQVKAEKLERAQLGSGTPYQRTIP